jgi:hypothetical protein
MPILFTIILAVYLLQRNLYSKLSLAPVITSTNHAHQTSNRLHSVVIFTFAPQRKIVSSSLAVIILLGLWVGMEMENQLEARAVVCACSEQLVSLSTEHHIFTPV